MVRSLVLKTLPEPSISALTNVLSLYPLVN
nr:MAG TPA: hypothetical protein [Caudoviricetes sp.]